MGKKVVIGDGLLLSHYQRKYPHALFLGAQIGEGLAKIYASADVFVFPTKTDTFRLVSLEALASGLPVTAYYPVEGPIDVIQYTLVDAFDNSLENAVRRA